MWDTPADPTTTIACALGNYLLLVDCTGRLFRDGKAAISREVAEILDRLGSGAETWQVRLQKLSKGRLLGRFFAASRKGLHEVAGRLGLRRVPNLGGCSASWHWHGGSDDKVLGSPPRAFSPCPRWEGSELGPRRRAWRPGAWEAGHQPSPSYLKETRILVR